MASVPIPAGHETRTHRIAAVVASLVLGLGIFMPLGAVVAFAGAFWIKQRQTRIWLPITRVSLALASLRYLDMPRLPWTSTSVSTGGIRH